MTDTERKTAAAWAHIRQCGSTVVERTDSLRAGYLALKKAGKITFVGKLARLTGE